MNKLILRIAALGTVFVLVATAAPAALAHSGEDDSSRDDSSSSADNAPDYGDSDDDRSKPLQTTAAGAEDTSRTAKNRAIRRLTVAKLRVCEQRAKTIKNIMTRSITRGDKQIDLFSTIATRVEAFYARKGKVLTNYEDLVSAVNNAKSDAEATLSILKSSTFSCDSDNPKGQAAAFKENLEALRQALKDYRTSVKNLIVGVKSVQGDRS